MQGFGLHRSQRRARQMTQMNGGRQRNIHKRDIH
jgi:hypothetical protein